ncbi:class I SAM-dependent methyltransferase [Spirillospora sp. NPDC048911]|uniref:class I SAM-dependent methyltransferase n=1 Tax=Spirillospora sp. NPDC048911 TaxID=3364527 RepID=UPI003717F3D9
MMAALDGARDQRATAESGYSGTSPAAIRSHYDLSNEFYGLWLDAGRTYSCALWEAAGDTLEAAQERKLDHLIEGARAAGAGHVLDVGCGWGSLLARLTGEHNAGEAVGLTLSPRQADWVAGLGLARCEVRVENWIDHAPALRSRRRIPAVLRAVPVLAAAGRTARPADQRQGQQFAGQGPRRLRPVQAGQHPAQLRLRQSLLRRRGAGPAGGTGSTPHGATAGPRPGTGRPPHIPPPPHNPLIPDNASPHRVRSLTTPEA